MENIISKELLNEVLGCEVEIRGFKDKHIPANFEYIKDMIDVKAINIHELAYKCKEWAYNLGFEVIEEYGKVRVYNSYKKEVYAVINMCEIENFKPFDTTNLFKACQWILDNSTH